MMKLFHADLAFIDGVVWIIVMFLSGVWTLILTAPIHIGVWANWCNATFLKICCEEQTNSSTSWMGWGGINIQQMFIFGCTILLNVDKIVYFAILNMHDYMVSCVLCFFFTSAIRTDLQPTSYKMLVWCTLLQEPILDFWGPYICKTVIEWLWTN